MRELARNRTLRHRIAESILVSTSAADTSCFLRRFCREFGLVDVTATRRRSASKSAMIEATSDEAKCPDDAIELTTIHTHFWGQYNESRNSFGSSILAADTPTSLLRQD